MGSNNDSNIQEASPTIHDSPIPRLKYSSLPRIRGNTLWLVPIIYTAIPGWIAEWQMTSLMIHPRELSIPPSTPISSWPIRVDIKVFKARNPSYQGDGYTLDEGNNRGVVNPMFEVVRKSKFLERCDPEKREEHS